MGIAIFFSYINIYFYELGFSLAQIGLLVALGPLVSLVAQPLWGIVSDRTSKRRVLMFVTFCTAISSLLFPLHSAFVYIGLIVVINSGFGTSMMPLGDAITLKFLEGKDVNYSTVRVTGAISFAIMAAVAGNLLFGNIVNIFYWNTAFLLLTLLAIYWMPSEPALTKTAETKSGVMQLFQNKVILVVFLSAFALGVANSFVIAFVGVRLAAIGANNSQIGIAMSIAAISEIPILLFVNKLFGKYKPIHLLLFVTLITTTRMLLMAFGETIPIVFLAQTLHGLTFMVHFYFSVVLINEHTPDHLKSTAQTLHAMFRMGMSALLGGAGAGLLSDYIGMQNVFLIMAVFVFSTCFILPGVLLLLHRLKKHSS